MQEKESRIVLTDPAPIPKSDDCPRCGAPRSRRVLSGGFGRRLHDVCGACGYDFEERTL